MLAVAAGSLEKCRAADVFFFDTPPAKRAERGKPSRGSNGPHHRQRAGGARHGRRTGKRSKAAGLPIFAQFKPSIQVELSFAARVCELDGADRDAIVKAAKDELWAFAVDLAKDPNRLQQFQQGVWIVRLIGVPCNNRRMRTRSRTRSSRQFGPRFRRRTRGLRRELEKRRWFDARRRSTALWRSSTTGSA